jgi:hypothetical protein
VPTEAESGPLGAAETPGDGQGDPSADHSAAGAERAGGHAASPAGQRGATQGLAAKREYPAHSDGVVCRCAVHWRRETLARGLNRLFAESEEAPER